MEKTEANVRSIVENIMRIEQAPNFNVDSFVRSYLSGENYEPANEKEEEIQGYSEETLENVFDRFKPTEKEEWEMNAPKIIVKIGGKEFKTFLDAGGVQRFCGNTVIAHLMSDNDIDGKLSLNTLTREYYRGKFSSEDWLVFMTSFGYSVCGLLDWSEFQHLPVENPLWD